MQAQTSPRQANNVWAWVIAGFGVILMVLLLLSFMADAQPSPTSEVAGANSNRVAYLQFGLAADTLWLADPAAPQERQELLTIPHAAEYGILPSISPDGERFAYTALPAGLSSPGPDSPAELWIAALDAGQPRMLAKGVDLLVPPLWTPDSASVIYRRSDTGTHTLAITSAGGGEERIIAYSETEALFPVAFVRDGAGLFYVGLNEDEGSHLYEVDLNSGVPAQVATLSPGLTRDWALSPEGTRLAFLEIAFTDAEVVSRASVLELGTGDVLPLTSAEDVAFAPVWSDAGELAIGVFDQATSESALLIVNGESRTEIAGSERGFDVPLAYNAAADAYLVTAFENDSIIAPGRSTLVLVGADGERKTIAEGEVILVGWTHP
jgi:dipeptidyl aminopeptidase/acylaminoacyl peptidase